MRNNRIVECLTGSSLSDTGLIQYLEAAGKEARLLLLMPEEEERLAWEGSDNNTERRGESLLSYFLSKENILWIRDEQEITEEKLLLPEGFDGGFDIILAVGTGRILQWGYRLSSRYFGGVVPVVGCMRDLAWKRMIPGRMFRCSQHKAEFVGMRSPVPGDKIFWKMPKEHCRKALLYWEMSFRIWEADRTGRSCERRREDICLLWEMGQRILSENSAEINRTEQEQSESIVSEWENRLYVWSEGSIRLLAEPLELFYGIDWEWAVYYVLQYFAVSETGGIADTIHGDNSCGMFCDREEYVHCIHILHDKIWQKECFLPEGFRIDIKDAAEMSLMAKENKSIAPERFLIKEPEIEDFYLWLTS